jgi:hypothetical protein
MLLANDVAKWASHVFRSFQILTSNANTETGYLDWGVSWFYSIPSGKLRDFTLD